MIIEIKEHSFFENLLSENNVVIDLGACKGEFINEFRKKYKTSKSILVEANPTNFILLPNDNNIKKYNNVISNKDDEIISFFEDTNSPYNGSKIFNYFNGKEHKIKTISLEKIINENQIDKIDLLKIDIEGSEYEILEHMPKKIFNIIKQITVEFHDFVDPTLKQRTNDLIKKIESFGFERISKPIKYMYNSDNYDVLFYKK